jgi:hypothetical protein
MTERCAHGVIEWFPENPPAMACLIGPKQVRRLHALWCQWTGSLGLLPAADRQLSHYYIGSITRGRAGKTRELTESDAAQVIQWLGNLVRRAEAPQRYAAGTAGRRGVSRSSDRYSQAPQRGVRFGVARRRLGWNVPISKASFANTMPQPVYANSETCARWLISTASRGASWTEGNHSDGRDV